MRRQLLACTGALALVLATGCNGEGEGDIVRVRVPRGASFSQITDSLAAKDIVAAPPLFEAYARVTGAASKIRPGTYGFRRNTGWRRVLDDLVAGRVLLAKLVIPEGWDLRGIAPRVSQITGLAEDSVLEILANDSLVRVFDVPGPTLEGYLYPATYTFPLDPPIDSVLDDMVDRYQQVWTAQRRARADSIRMNEREVVTLASIIEKEAKKPEEMPLISSVFHNRLRIGYPLQADPTVQYALGVHRERLLYSSIDSARNNPYNTYRNAGLPPGPIASPS
ncbi:MAG: endolytic transglycosylase MltG, partial [Longimicrobiales bacterium]